MSTLKAAPKHALTPQDLYPYLHRRRRERKPVPNSFKLNGNVGAGRPSQALRHAIGIEIFKKGQIRITCSSNDYLN